MLLELVTPEKIVISEEVDEVTAPTTTGEITVLPKHVGLVTQVSPGELTVRKSGKLQHFAIMGGILEVSKDKVVILGEYAIRADDIEIAKAEEAKRRAEQRMKEKVSEEDFATIQGELGKALLELKVARKRRR
ncbi:MAG: ATP synthase F1 subunit epsilon [Patescibacteria group bacterium]